VFSFSRFYCSLSIGIACAAGTTDGALCCASTLFGLPLFWTVPATSARPGTRSKSAAFNSVQISQPPRRLRPLSAYFVLQLPMASDESPSFNRTFWAVTVAVELVHAFQAALKFDSVV